MKAKPAAPASFGKRKVLLVDDHPFMREGLAKRINPEPDLIVCGEAASAREARSAVARLHPDLVVLDLSLADCLALDLIKDIKAFAPKAGVLIFTMHEEAVYAERALRAGARGYVMKQEPPERFLAGLRAVLRGDFCVSQNVEAGFLQAFLHPPASGGVPAVSRLTNREMEVFHLLGQGLSTRDIGARLSLSVKTIETYRANIKEKLNLKSAPELISHASRWLESRGEIPPATGGPGPFRKPTRVARRPRLL